MATISRMNRISEIINKQSDNHVDIQSTTEAGPWMPLTAAMKSPGLPPAGMHDVTSDQSMHETKADRCGACNPYMYTNVIHGA